MANEMELITIAQRFKTFKTLLKGSALPCSPKLCESDKLDYYFLPLSLTLYILTDSHVSQTLFVPTCATALQKNHKNARSYLLPPQPRVKQSKMKYLSAQTQLLIRIRKLDVIPNQFVLQIVSYYQHDPI